MVSLGTGMHVPTRTLAQTSRNGSGQFEVARVSGLTNQQKDLFFVPHRKDFYLLAIVQQGTTRHWVDGAPYTLEPDTLYFSAPHQVFLKEDGAFEAVSLCFTPEFLDLEQGTGLRQLPILQNPHSGHALRLQPADRAFVDDITAKMLDEQHQAHPMQASMLLAYLRVLLLYLSRLYTEQFSTATSSPDRVLLQQFRALVDERFARHHDVAGYAALLHLSPGHLGDRIKEQSGKTPIEHIHARLLLEAKRLLFHTDATVKEIAFHLGFDEASYFNRFFKRLTASTPAAYRTAIREMYH